MSIKNTLMPYFAATLTSPGLRRFRRFLFQQSERFQGQPAQATLYFRADDPHSWLLAQQLPDFVRQYGISLQPRIIHYLPDAMYPEPELHAQWALRDARHCARMHHLYFPAQPVAPSRKDAFAAARILLAQENDPGFLSIAQTLCRHLWTGNMDGVYALGSQLQVTDKDTAEQVFRARQQQATTHGHYLTGALHYGGETYWGPDRLDHLAERLCQARGEPFPADWLQWRKFQFAPAPASLLNTPLELFFSFRSPYSWLALERASRLARFYKLKLVIKPVLPMVMRGLPVPKAKRRYILLDAKREAERAGVPFGKICDPVGQGVENCMALWPYAARLNRLEQYVSVAARAIWSEGVDTASSRGLRKIVAAAGLDWQNAQAYLADNSWREQATRHRDEMLAAGIWGVPAFRFDGDMFWGQDRLVAIENRILDKNRPA